MSFTVAIVGRPNVGKSTLFNRLTGTRHALVDDTPGVTRDRREGIGNLGPLTFNVFDTAGMEEAEKGSLAARMTAQSVEGLELADVVLMLVDVRAGITPMDRHFSDIVRKSGKPAILVLNKAEGKLADQSLGEAYALGLGDPLPISAEHGEGMTLLYEALLPFAGDPDQDDEVEEEAEDSSGPMQIAIVGRPNAGKSTLINKLLGEERVLTGPEAGITRDAIAVPFIWKGREIRLVDTAGMRKKSNVVAKLEKMSVGDTLRAIQYAQVVVLMMDATQALEKQDLQIAALVEREGRALILAINKWDLVAADIRPKYLKVVEERLGEALAQLDGIPILPISAEKGKGIDKLMEKAMSLESMWSRRISTGELNRWLEDMIAHHSPPLINGRRLKIRYITQPKSRPPTFMLSANISDIPAHYLRYMVRGLREHFGLAGIPLRFKVKKGKNPYEKEKR